MKVSSICVKVTVFIMFILFTNFLSFSYAIIDENEITQLLKEETLDNIDTNFNVKNNNTEKDEMALINKNTNHESAEEIQPIYQQETPNEVVNWMYKNGLTINGSLDKFNPYNIITRDQMAKFAVNFALLINKQRNVNPHCGFKDIYKGDKSLIPYMLSACNMSIIKGSNGYAKPSKSLTKAEAITIIMRLIRNDISTNAKPWYKNVYNIAKAYGITHDSINNMNKKTTRLEVAIMLYRAYRFLND